MRSSTARMRAQMKITDGQRKMKKNYRNPHRNGREVKTPWLQGRNRGRKKRRRAIVKLVRKNTTDVERDIQRVTWSKTSKKKLLTCDGCAIPKRD